MELSAKCVPRNSVAKWRFQSKPAGDHKWTYYDRPLLKDLRTLKEILVRKYTRQRASTEDVASIEKLIAEQSGHE
jgi:hypothetical protein